MIKTIKELLIEWWAINSTTRMPIHSFSTVQRIKNQFLK